MAANQRNRARVATWMSWFGKWLAISTVISACQVQACDLDLPPSYGEPPGPSCPAGSDLSPLTPTGLDLELPPVAFDWFPSGNDRVGIDLAIAGSATMTVLASDGTPLPFPYVASSDDPEFVAVGSQRGSDVELHGGAQGSACIELADPDTNEVFDGFWLDTLGFHSAVVVPAGTVHELIDDEFQAFAFAAGDLEVGVGYLGGNAGTGPRLIDLGATLELYRATQLDWQTLAFPNATAGTYTIAATIGNTSFGASFDVVDPTTGARQVVRFDVDLPDLACFAALTASQAFIIGLRWQFTIDDAAATASDEYANCVAIPRDGVVHTITALAAGQSAATSAEAQ